MTRSEIREHIFRLVFRLEFASAEDVTAQLEGYFSNGYDEGLPGDEDECISHSFSEDDKGYIRDKYNRIVSRISSLDETINSNSRSWDTARMGKVDLAILRLAVFEMMHDDIPVGVAIDEAVELAKKYGQDSSASFVNGVLAGVARSVSDPSQDREGTE
ncbi:MAG: transcription antitermination factor NusB [Lachnospiraceae bacterium]|nr:transcription antitermination factor NusB [Lachnospiraceae bacterium]